jgi:hypothetical protein
LTSFAPLNRLYNALIAPRLMKRGADGWIMKVATPTGVRKLNRTGILNAIAAATGARRYLEIGCRDNVNFNAVICPEKASVDPDPHAAATFPVTSDRFFAENPDLRFDLVFVDGLHTDEQVRRDVENALARLDEGGTIVLHDCNPPDAFSARPEFTRPDLNWNGTVWQAWVHFRATRPDLDMEVVDVDWGVGIIRRGAQAVLSETGTDYEWLERNRVAALNLKSPEHFVARWL